MRAEISYGKTNDAWIGYKQFILELVDKHQAKTICEIGGGANPLIEAKYMHTNNIDYSILDVSEEELFKAPKEYKKIKADISAPEIMIKAKFDLVFSKMLAEHIKDAKQFHRNILKMLNSGGLAVHFFPTLYTIPFLVNRLVPEKLASRFLNYFAPRDSYQYAKFPAYYSWCRGPTSGQIQKFNGLGYEVVEYRGYFGHSEYYNRVKLIKRLHELKTSYLLRNPNPIFTSYAYTVLRKA